MPAEFKVSDKGVWIYKEREFCLEVGLSLEPVYLEQLIVLLGYFVKSNSDGAYVRQIAGGASAEGKLLGLKMMLNSDEGGILATHSLFTKFFSYQNLSVLSTLREAESYKLFKGLKSLQIIRQVGATFNALEIGIKFYSSKSQISKWFKVPMEEGSLTVSITNSNLKCQANLRKICDEVNLNFVREVLGMLAEISGVNVQELDRFWDLDRSLV